mgnify:FL=1
MSEFSVEVVAHRACRVGENPLWDERRQSLFWCDILGGEIYCWNLASGAVRVVYRGEICGAFTLEENGDLLLLRDRELALLDVENGQVQTLRREVVPPTGRFNDALAAPDGAVFSGTIDPVDDWHGQGGALFQIAPDASAQTLFRGTACSNGLAFTPDLCGLYWSDSTSRTLYRFDYNAQTGQARNPQIWLRLGENESVPDGLCVDCAGNVWLALFGASCVRCYSPQAHLRANLVFPTPKITSCVFGGPDLSELFVTSAGGDRSLNANSPDAKSQNLAGALFRVRRTKTDGPKGFFQGQSEFRSKFGPFAN